MGVKKYKLFQDPSNDGTPRPCAFFLSGNGCRNGDNCKFAHVNAASAIGNVVELNEFREISSEEKSVVSSNESGEVVVKAEPIISPALSEGDVGKKRKNRRGLNNNNPFPTKSKKIAKTEQEPHDEEERLKLTSQSSKETPIIKSTPTITPGSSSSTSQQQRSGKTGFRAMNLPIADFELKSTTTATIQVREITEPTKSDKIPEIANQQPLSVYPLPKSTVLGQKWLSMVQKCQEDSKFRRHYDFAEAMKADDLIGGKTAWIKAKPFGDWCRDNPQVIAIDCEMCEIEDPVSKQRNPNALCRVSIVDVATDEVLLNSLVKPEWPVVDYRTFINGISENDLANVQFTVRHCQAFLMALCSEETVILGHAVHHDLKAMRMEHYCVADSSLLFRPADNENGTVALRDLALALLGKEMPKIHDSVNDARTALLCLKHYLEKDGHVEAIVRKPPKHLEAASQLFVHRIPKHVTPKHVEEMLLDHAKIAPDQVDAIDYSGAGNMGKTWVKFQTPAHANLAFATLAGTAELDSSKRLQKKVFMRDGQYIRIRKMFPEKNPEKNRNPPSATTSTTRPGSN